MSFLLRIGYILCYGMAVTAVLMCVVFAFALHVEIGWLLFLLLSGESLARIKKFSQWARRIRLGTVAIIIIHFCGLKILGAGHIYQNNVFTNPTTVTEISTPTSLRTEDGREIILVEIELHPDLKHLEMPYHTDLWSLDSKPITVEYDESNQTWITQEPIRYHHHGYIRFFPMWRPGYRAVPLEDYLTGIHGPGIFRKMEN